MPTYDLILLIKKADQSFLKTVLTRSANYIFESGGILRKMENLGYQFSVEPIKKTGQKKEKGAHYFILNYDAGYVENKDILNKFKRDLDVLKFTSLIDKLVPGENDPKPIPECTMYMDYLPAPNRPAIVELLKKGQERKDKKDRKKPFRDGVEYSF